MPLHIAWHKAAATVGGSVLALSVLATSLGGTAALATNVSTAAPAVVETHPQRENGFEKLAAVLTGLVEKGVITEQQKTAILEAVKAAYERRDHDRDREDLRRFLGNVFEASVQYIGLPAEAVKAQLEAGKSLGQIANQRPGKSREGLIDYLQSGARDRIKKAVEDGKLTPEQAERVRTAVDAMIVKIVDHEGGRTK